MSYSRTTWIPEETPLSADNFNNIEDGIQELMSRTSSLDNQKVDKVTGKELSTNDYTTAEKNKLAGIAARATANTVTNSLTSTSTTAALSAAQGKALNDNKAAKSDAIKNITRSGTTFTATKADGSTFTFTQQDNNTTYSAATTSAAGLMSAADKTKLNGITASAKNVKVVSFSTVGTISIAAGGYKSLSIGARETGWTLIGVVGYSIGGATSTWVSMSKCDVSGDYIDMILRNHGASETNVTVTVKALFIA